MIYVKTLGHSASAWLPEGLEMEVGHWNSQLCLCDRAPVKIMDTKARIPWTAILHVHCLTSYQENQFHLWLNHERATFTPCTELSSTVPYASFPLADSNLYLFTIVNHHCEKNSLWWVLWFLLTNYQTYMWSRELSLISQLSLLHCNTITISRESKPPKVTKKTCFTYK